MKSASSVKTKSRGGFHLSLSGVLSNPICSVTSFLTAALCVAVFAMHEQAEFVRSKVAPTSLLELDVIQG